MSIFRIVNVLIKFYHIAFLSEKFPKDTDYKF